MGVSIPSRECSLLRPFCPAGTAAASRKFQSLVGSVVYCGSVAILNPTIDLFQSLVGSVVYCGVTRLAIACIHRWSVSIPSRECSLLRPEFEEIAIVAVNVSIPSRECSLLRLTLKHEHGITATMFQSLVGSVVYCGLSPALKNNSVSIDVSIPSRECSLLRQELPFHWQFPRLFQSLVGSVVYCGPIICKSH